MCHESWTTRIILIAVALLLVLGWIVHFHNAAVTAHAPKWLQASLKRLGEKTDAAAPEEEDPDNAKNEIPIHTARVELRTLHRYVEGFGQVAPRPPAPGQMAGAANLSTAVPGVVAKVLAQMGQAVKVGDAVIQLDDRVAKAAEEQATAALNQAKAALAALKATPRPDQLQIAELGVSKAQSALDFAQKNYERLKELAAGQGVSTKSVEQAAQELAAAKTELAINQKQLDLLKHMPTPEDLRQEEAKVAQAEALLASAHVQRQMLTIASPIDATVTSISTNPGDAVDVTKPLAQLVALDRLVVDVDLPADQLPANAQGLEAQVFAPGAKPTDAPTVTGKIGFVSPQVDPKTGAVMTSIDLPADAALRPGLAVRVRIVAEEHKDVLAVPRAAVVNDENGDPVISLVEGQQATHKRVTTGAEENGMIEISADDLKPGDTVATAGAFGLPQASHVKVMD